MSGNIGMLTGNLSTPLARMGAAGAAGSLASAADSKFLQRLLRLRNFDSSVPRSLDIPIETRVSVLFCDV